MEVVDEQPKLTGSGVTDIPVEDDDKEDLGGVKKNLLLNEDCCSAPASGLSQQAGTA